VPSIDYIRAEIERMRAQVHRQRGEIRQTSKEPEFHPFRQSPDYVSDKHKLFYWFALRPTN
jgi:hypothetical protein